jgi:outer membrane protein OmpA-like peptidoglycan-associated protein
MIETNKLLLRRRTSGVGLLLLSLLGFAGCSSVPDAVNPVEWYRGASSWFESDEDQAQRDQARTAKETAPPLPGTDKPYPNLSTVPERPHVSPPEERSRVQKGLAADRANAHYARPDAERPTGSEVGAPSAAPRTPVTVAPSGPSPDTLEPLPRDIAPGPRSSLDDAGPTRVARAPAPVARPAIQKATYRPGRDARPALIRTGGTMDVSPSHSQPKQTNNPAPTRQADRPATTGVKAEPTAPLEDLPRSFMVYFGGGSATLDGADRDLLKEVARLYRSHGGTLRVVGHASSSTRETDALQHQIANLRISTKRAEAVAGELAKLGVPRAKMTVGGVSDSEPLYKETTQAGIAGNRRVEIFFGP